MNVNVNNKIIAFMLGVIQHYNPNRYWKYREYAINKKYRNYIFKLYALLYVKRCDAYNCASFGTDLNKGAQFQTIPHLPHGIKGIIIHPSCRFGENVTIYQHVTIGKKMIIQVFL